jgi:hypothetical protein
MDPLPRHQCLIYDGQPTRHLPALAATLREKLRRNYRCLYLNSPAMVEGMRSLLASAEVDVEAETARGSLVISAEQAHLVNGRFDVNRMIETLGQTLDGALREGYFGLWASGDMSWEFGPEQDFGKLLEYEMRLEEFFEIHPEIYGICQYQKAVLPSEAMKHGLLAHPALYMNETLSLINPYYTRQAGFDAR